MTRVQLVTVGAWQTLDVPALLAGSLRIRLDGATVRLHLAGAVLPSAATELVNVGTAFRPSLTTRRFLLPFTTAGGQVRLSVFASGAVWVADGDPARVVDAEVSWSLG